MRDLVQRLRADRTVQQFDSAGRLIEFAGTPTPLELEAADRIAELEAALSFLFSRCSDSQISPYCDEMKVARKALGYPPLPEDDNS